MMGGARNMKEFTIRDINQSIEGRIVGNRSLTITKVEQIDSAKSNQLTFIGHKKYIKKWEKSRASAAILKEGYSVAPGKGRALIFVPNVDIAIAKVLELFRPREPLCPTGIHPTAIIDTTALVGDNVSIGAGCYIGPGVTIGNNSSIHAYPVDSQSIF